MKEDHKQRNKTDLDLEDRANILHSTFDKKLKKLERYFNPINLIVVKLDHMWLLVLYCCYLYWEHIYDSLWFFYENLLY